MRREVALKVLPRDLVKSPEALRRFHREVQAAAKLHHPNIAAAYDADEDDGVHFLVMELVEGPDLAGYVAEAGELPAPVAVQLTLQAARGLAHAHLQGVVHRDIKPANLVVNVQGTLKILDMGLAQLRSLGADEGVELTHMGQAMGTIDYMAPEQAVDAHSVDHRADIYSLGCTMFYLLTGRPISPEGSMVQKLLWHQTASRPSLREACSDATERLDLIFQRMVAASADDRYSLMRDVVEDLERVLPELRLGDAELPLVGDDLARYIGMEAVAPHSLAHGRADTGSSLPPLRATLPPQKSTLPSSAAGTAAAAPAVALIEQQLAAAAIMIGKEVSAETADGRVIRGVVNRLSVETHPGNPQARAVRLHIGSADFGVQEIREVFQGNGSTH
jgi:serine/threonine protein kinase